MTVIQFACKPVRQLDSWSGRRLVLVLGPKRLQNVLLVGCWLDYWLEHHSCKVVGIFTERVLTCKLRYVRAKKKLCNKVPSLGSRQAQSADEFNCISTQYGCWPGFCQEHNFLGTFGHIFYWKYLSNIVLLRWNHNNESRAGYWFEYMYDIKCQFTIRLSSAFFKGVVMILVSYLYEGMERKKQV